MEKIYSVSFFKKLTDSTGHMVDACQGTVEVHAADKASAIERARLKFAELEEVNVWSLRADYEKAKLLPARKRTSGSVWRNSRSDHAAHL